MTDAYALLCKDIVNVAEGSTLIDAIAVPWQSMALDGEHHTIRLNVDDVAIRLARTLPDHEFTMPGLLVADIAITAIDRTRNSTILTIEALTLNELLSPGP